MIENIEECGICEGEGLLEDGSECPECFGLGSIDPVNQEYLHLMAQGKEGHHPVILLKGSMDLFKDHLSNLRRKISNLEERVDLLEKDRLLTQIILKGEDIQKSYGRAEQGIRQKDKG